MVYRYNLFTKPNQLPNQNLYRTSYASYTDWHLLVSILGLYSVYFGFNYTLNSNSIL
ncbi:Orf14 [Heliothis zea nudivirus]|uniref:Orf14 n=1 Tax=Heliothis zea nudivirus 1 TaxID=3116536 RepID=Q8JKU7_9VIRU|nr:Orf14 [Heliothis zea nudivirus]AAN04309.1 Orf14 [Heliothis zea nudivirus]